MPKFTKKEELRGAIERWGDAGTKLEPPNEWDVSAITDMSNLFYDTPFNEDISSWDVSNVTSMEGMFSKATHFNQPISKWNVSNVTNMDSMFRDAAAFNQDVSRWNVSKVTDMTSMFRGAKKFNQDLSMWNVSNVTVMAHMFAMTEAFNQDLSLWNVSKVTDMTRMFFMARRFVNPIIDWTIDNVTKANDMFKDCPYELKYIVEWGIRNKAFHTSIQSFPDLFKTIESVPELKQFMTDSSRTYLMNYEETNLYPFGSYPRRYLYIYDRGVQKLLIEYIIRDKDLHVYLIMSGDTFIDLDHLNTPYNNLRRKNALQVDSVFQDYYKQLPSINPYNAALNAIASTKKSTAAAAATKKSTAAAATSGGYGKHVFGLLCAYARSKNLEVTLDVMNGRHNARAYCMYARFGLHMTVGNTGFTNYVYPMTSDYANENISVADILDVASGRKAHVSSATFEKRDKDFCTNKNLQEQVKNVGREMYEKYEPIVQQTNSRNKRASKRSKLQQYVQLHRRQLMSHDNRGHNPQDLLDEFTNMSNDSDVTVREDSPTVPFTKTLSPTEEEFFQDLSQPRVGTKRKASSTRILGKATRMQYLAATRKQPPVFPIAPAAPVSTDSSVAIPISSQPRHPSFVPHPMNTRNGHNRHVPAPHRMRTRSQKT